MAARSLQRPLPQQARRAAGSHSLRMCPPCEQQIVELERLACVARGEVTGLAEAAERQLAATMDARKLLECLQVRACGLADEMQEAQKELRSELQRAEDASEARRGRLDALKVDSRLRQAAELEEFAALGKKDGHKAASAAESAELKRRTAQLDRHCERLVWLREICDERAAHVATKSQPDRLPEGSVPELEVDRVEAAAGAVRSLSEQWRSWQACNQTAGGADGSQPSSTETFRRRLTAMANKIRDAERKDPKDSALRAKKAISAPITSMDHSEVRSDDLASSTDRAQTKNTDRLGRTDSLAGRCQLVKAFEIMQRQRKEPAQMRLSHTAQDTPHYLSHMDATKRSDAKRTMQTVVPDWGRLVDSPIRRWREPVLQAKTSGAQERLKSLPQLDTNAAMKVATQGRHLAGLQQVGAQMKGRNEKDTKVASRTTLADALQDTLEAEVAGVGLAQLQAAWAAVSFAQMPTQRTAGE